MAKDEKTKDDQLTSPEKSKEENERANAKRAETIDQLLEEAKDNEAD